MAHQIIRQPNNNYSIWSSVAEGFIATDLTKNELYNYYTLRAKREAEDKINNILNSIENNENFYHQFKLTWEEALEKHVSKGDAQI